MSLGWVMAGVERPRSLKFWREPEMLWRCREVEGIVRLAGRPAGIPCPLTQHSYQVVRTQSLIYTLPSLF